MILYWLTIAALVAAVILSARGAGAASRAGSTWWLRFHVALAWTTYAALVLFAVIAAPIAYKL